MEDIKLKTYTLKLDPEIWKLLKIDSIRRNETLAATIRRALESAVRQGKPSPREYAKALERGQDGEVTR